MPREIIDPPELIAPSGFAHAVRVGETVSLGGQTAMDREGRIVPGGIGALWQEMAGTEYPAMAGIGITRLWQPEALIEIKATAHLAPAS